MVTSHPQPYSHDRMVGRRTLTGVLGALVVSLLVGCSTDVQMINRGYKAREAGIRSYHEGQYADAAGSFRNAVRQDARDYKSYYYLGASYEALRQYEQAIQAYKTALDVTGRTLEGQENIEFQTRIMDSLAALVAKVDDRGVERSAIEKQAAERRSARDYRVLAKIHRAAGDPDSAIDAYNRGSLMDPKDFYLAKEYGLYLVQIGQTQKADVPLRQAYRLNPQDAQVVAALRQMGVVPETITSQVEKDLMSPSMKSDLVSPSLDAVKQQPKAGEPGPAPQD